MAYQRDVEDKGGDCPDCHLKQYADRNALSRVWHLHDVISILNGIVDVTCTHTSSAR